MLQLFEHQTPQTVPSAADSDQAVARLKEAFFRWWNEEESIQDFLAGAGGELNTVVAAALGSSGYPVVSSPIVANAAGQGVENVVSDIAENHVDSFSLGTRDLVQSLLFFVGAYNQQNSYEDAVNVTGKGLAETTVLYLTELEQPWLTEQRIDTIGSTINYAAVRAGNWLVQNSPELIQKIGNLSDAISGFTASPSSSSSPSSSPAGSSPLSVASVISFATLAQGADPDTP